MEKMKTAELLVENLKNFSTKMICYRLIIIADRKPIRICMKIF